MTRAKKPSYKIWADFRLDFGVLQTSAQIAALYTSDKLINKTIIGCVNLGEKNIAGFTSQFLLCGFVDTNGNVCIATVDKPVPNGSKMF